LHRVAEVTRKGGFLPLVTPSGSRGNSIVGGLSFCKPGPIAKILPSDGCKGDAVPLAGERWYDFPEFGGYLVNVGKYHSGEDVAEI